MGTICFPPPIAIYTIFLQVSKQSSLYKHPVACDLFKTELLHFNLYLPYPGYEARGLVWLTSELAVIGGSGRACMRRRKYIASFLLGKTDQPVES